MRTELADDLEAFVEAGALWDPDAVGALVDLFQAESDATGDPLPAQLARHLGAVLWRLQLGPVPTRLAADVEAVRGGLPEGELRIRIEVMGRRLARTFAEEAV